MNCEAKSCETLPIGYSSTKLFGGVDVQLCSPHLRMWQLDPKVLELVEKHNRAEESLILFKCALQGGQTPAEEDYATADKLLDTMRDTKAEARNLAVEMFGLEL